MTTAWRTASIQSSRRPSKSQTTPRSRLNEGPPRGSAGRSASAAPAPLDLASARRAHQSRLNREAQPFVARRALPDWLRLLIQVQRGSVVVAFVLVTAALVVYGSTIYMQQNWSKGYNKLKSMQRSERQMIAAEGLIKEQLIQQAEQPEAGLVPRTSQHTVVLQIAPERVPVTANPVAEPAPPSDQSAPVSY